MPEWQRIERYLNPIGLFLILIFPIAAGIPIAGYISETAALFFVILFSFRRKRLLVTIGAIGSMILVSLLSGPGLLLLGVWGMIIIPGTILGRFMGAGYSPVRAFLAAMLVSSLISVIIFLMEKEIIFQTLDFIPRLIPTGIGGGGAATSGNDLIDWTMKMISILKRLMPSMMALSGVAQLFLGALVLMLFLRSAGEFVPSFGNFVFWKMPYNYIFLTGICIMMRLIGTEMIKIVADNLLLYIGIFYAVFGFSVFEYYFRRIKLSLFLRVLFYIGFALLQFPGLILAAGVGVFDSYFDFRKVKARVIG